MGREQSEKLNTSPSRGSGYQVINDLFDRQQDFIVVGLCGKTGSGVSTTAEILNKEFEELHLNAEPPAAGTDYERHEYRLLYNYARRNWNCFYLVKTRALITARVLGKTADAFTQFLCELVNADKCNNEEESKSIIKPIVENQLYNAAMTFEINTQFKLKEKGLPNTGIEAEKFFGIGENPLDDYDAILLNPKAEREQRPIVDLTSLQGNNCEVKLPGAEEDGEPTAIHSLDRNPNNIKYYGFGMPSTNTQDILQCSSDEITLVFRQKIMQGTHLEMVDFPYPKSLIHDGKCFGEIGMTLAYDPILDACYGREYCRTNIDASFGMCYTSKAGMQEFRGCVPLETTWDEKYEKSRVENGFKWSPIKSYYRKISSKGIKAGENWKIRINLTPRNGLVVTAQEFVLIITIRDAQGHDIYSEVVNGLRERGYITNNLETRQQIRQRQ